MVNALTNKQEGMNRVGVWITKQIEDGALAAIEAGSDNSDVISKLMDLKQIISDRLDDMIYMMEDEE